MLLVDTGKAAFQSSVSPLRSTRNEGKISVHTQQRANVLVAGSLAVDINCSYNPDKESKTKSAGPDMHTSNPAIVSQSLGGVGQNVASALNYLGTQVQFCSAVAADASGQTAIKMLADRGMRVDGVKLLKDGSRTAQYIAFNDNDNELVIAMADMRILENEKRDISVTWGSHLASSRPKWLVIDANWDPLSMKQWIVAGKAADAKIAYEPVSVGKSCRVFTPFHNLKRRLVHITDLATPNASELRTMYDYLEQYSYCEGAVNIWSLFLNSLEPQERFKCAQHQLADDLKDEDKFIVRCSLKLLPYFPCTLTKVGSSGVLLTELLRKDDVRLTAPWAKQHLFYAEESNVKGLSTRMYELLQLLRNQTDINPHGRFYIEKDYEYLNDYAGIYMRLFPPAEIVPPDEIVSVNGIGDTFLGIIVAGLAKERPKPMDELVMLAQRGSVMTLKSSESVSQEISSLRLLL